MTEEHLQELRDVLQIWPIHWVDKRVFDLVRICIEYNIQMSLMYEKENQVMRYQNEINEKEYHWFV